MSCKKHYTEVEKRLFLQLIKQYSHIIEKKKSDSSSLKDKEEAWNRITDQYNRSSIILRERNVQQLKKVWSNMKTTQRDALTKERQSRLLTGGGPELPPVEIDPEIAEIVPSLMTTAPTVLSSNINDTLLEERRDAIFKNDNIAIDLLIDDGDEFLDNIIDGSDCAAPQKTTNDDVENIACSRKRKNKNRDMVLKEKKELDMLRLNRSQRLMEHEEALALSKMRHEEAKQKLELEKYAMDVRAATATAELAEYMLATAKKK